MTAARQRQVTRPRRGLWVAIGVLTCGIISPIAAVAAAFVHIVTDPQTGLAISGFDPVAYFTDAAPERGRPGTEYNFGGTVWRFRNEGNRAAFAENPDVYSPQFGGYDPVAIARGTSVPGHPLFWLVTGQRLYLFYSAEDRAAFGVESQRFIEAAERNWPVVQRTLP